MISDSGQTLEHAIIESQLNDAQRSHNLNFELLEQLFVGASVSRIIRSLGDRELALIAEHTKSAIDNIITTRGEVEAALAKPDYIGEDIHAQRFLLRIIENERRRRTRIPRIKAALARLGTASGG